MIREATASDTPALARLHASAFTFPSEYWNATMLAESLNVAGTSLLADWDAQQPAALILTRRMSDIAEILTLATAPTHQRKGLAKNLLAEACVRAKAGGATAMLLDVALDNTAAIALYTACGFVENGRRRGFYTRQGIRVDALLMRKIL